LGNEITRLKVSPQDLEMKKVEKEPETIQGMLRVLEDEFARPTKRKKKPKKS
jgi:hypothetical protein